MLPESSVSPLSLVSSLDGAGPELAEPPCDSGGGRDGHFLALRTAYDEYGEGDQPKHATYLIAKKSSPMPDKRDRAR